MRLPNFRIPTWLIIIGFAYIVFSIATLDTPEEVKEQLDEGPPRLLTDWEEVHKPGVALETRLRIMNEYYSGDKTAEKDIESVVCLAKNAYFEARNQSILSQIAVSQVVMNRVQHQDFPNTVCGVVYEAQLSKWYKEKLNKEVPLKDRCQFSWYCDGKADIIRDQDAYELALAVAHQVLSGYDMVDVTKGALWYHATYVRPYWAKEKLYTVKHEDHIFYTERN
jgi:spore germination cell wall hydrolase CwlJ-like protein|tara:strand:- start:117 stop:785 length:669 start_codon:yes stop_codon:yes gene_type:complete